jgi:Arc/MetJ-type ribon-helix-helix transcriptional regulator
MKLISVKMPEALIDGMDELIKKVFTLVGVL